MHIHIYFILDTSDHKRERWRLDMMLQVTLDYWLIDVKYLPS